MEKLTFQVAEFDAPLDLILHLLSRHKLDILDVDISSLLAQYLAAIESWREMDLEVTSEFLEMASRLVYIKTVSLLPKHEEETEKLKQELSGQLIEYRLLKLAAAELGEQSLFGDVFVRPPMELAADLTYTLTHPAALLYAALADAMGKGARRLPPPATAFEPLVTRPVVSVTSKIFTVLRALRQSREVGLDALFIPDNGRSSLIATFLAVLELIKSGKIRLEEGRLMLLKKAAENANREETHPA